MNTFNITLDLNKSKVTTPIRLRQGDLDGTTITALILDHGATADLTGLAARFVMELPGGEHYYRKDATVGEGSVTVVINEEQAASVTGRTTRAYFQLLDGETVRASTGSVTVDILPDALEGHTVPADYDSAIQDAIDALDDAVENIADTVEDVLEDHPEWTTTVQDGAVTDAKLYQGADGILARNARLMYRLDNMLTNALPEGDSATATDAAKTPLAGLALYGRSTQDGTPTPSAPVPIQSVEGNVVSEVKTGLFVNGSTSVIGTLEGAQTAVAHVSRNTDYTLTYEGGNRCIVGGVDSPNIASGDTVRILFNSNSRVSPKTFNSGENDYVAMFVATSAAPAANIALYAGSTAYTYVPYGSAGLWARGKNLLPLGVNSTSGGITFTVQDDGAVVVSGTASTTSFWGAAVTLPAGNYSFSGCPSGGGPSTYLCDIRNAVGGAGISGMTADHGSGGRFTLAEATRVYLNIRIANGYTATNLIFHLQIERGTTATAYQPYVETVTPIDLDGHELRSLPDGTRDELTVGADGRVTLVQRVGSYTFTGDELPTWNVDSVTGTLKRVGFAMEGIITTSDIAYVGALLCNRLVPVSNYDANNRELVGVNIRANDSEQVVLNLPATDFPNGASDVKAWLAENPTTLLYQLATPQIIDLGWTDAIPLCGPDLTAQAVPSAPFALTYERDLNTTLARLEAAIAALA